MELERNLLGARTEAHAKVEIYSGVARLSRSSSCRSFLNQWSMYDAATAASHRDLHFVKGAAHYFENQPALLVEAIDVIATGSPIR